MCGIAGVVSKSVISHQIPQKMCDAIRHRGPDDYGIWLNSTSTVALASQRLAIHDLSPAGHMPMASPDGKVVITFNGEIYNFKDLRNQLRGEFSFRSSSDTEVALASYLKWGKDCFTRFDGMFALAIWDYRAELIDGPMLILSRDRVGEKPLYYSNQGGNFVFASELRALLESGLVKRVLDSDTLNHFLAFGYGETTHTFVKDVQKLAPGCTFIWRPTTQVFKIDSYWNLPTLQERDASESYLVGRLQALLEESIARQLEADVQVGVLLSGGLDSSIVATLAAKVLPRRLKTFTVSLPSARLRHLDESQHAAKMAKHLGSEHFELPLEAEPMDILDSLVSIFDEPIADSSMIPTFLVSKLARKHVTVALGGDGGDELFGGYIHHGWAANYSLNQSMISGLSPGWVSDLVGMSASGSRGRNFLLRLLSTKRELFSMATVFDSWGRKRVLSRDLTQHLGTGFFNPEIKLSKTFDDKRSLVENSLRRDFMRGLPEDMLVKIDRASMASSLELRAPFLSRDLIEFAFGSVPDSQKAHGSGRKILLKKLGKEILPSGFEFERKQGFSIPLDQWLAGDWGRFAEDLISSAPSELFSRAELKRLLQDQRAGASNSTRIFALLVFELWRRHYAIELQ